MDRSSTVLKRLLSKDGCGERVVDVLQRLDREFAGFGRCLLSIHQRQLHHDRSCSPVSGVLMRPTAPFHSMGGSLQIVFPPRRNRNFWRAIPPTQTRLFRHQRMSSHLSWLQPEEMEKEGRGRRRRIVDVRILRD